MSVPSIPPVSGSVKKKSRKPKASPPKSDATADSAPPEAVRPLDMRRAIGELSSAEDAHDLVDELFDEVADTASVVAAALAPSSERRVLERLELRCDDAREKLHNAIDDVAVWVRPSRNLAIAAREVGAPSGLVAALAFTWRAEKHPDPPASVWSGVLRAQMKGWAGFEAAIVAELSEVCRAA
jgi:hypothetical protein